VRKIKLFLNVLNDISLFKIIAVFFTLNQFHANKTVLKHFVYNILDESFNHIS
jgi:hypothetical protein